MFFQPCHSWPHGLLGASQGRCVSCAVSSLLRHVGVMTSETLAGRGPGAGWWSWRRGRDEGKGSGGTSVSTALTLTPNWDYTPRKNRRISTIPAGRTGAGLVDVSAVDTGPRRSESGVLAAQPGASVTGPPPPTPAHHLRRVPVVMDRRRTRSRVLPRVGLIHEGRDPLTKGCAYRTKTPPTLSTPDPRPVTPTPRAVHPADAGSHHSDRASPFDRPKQQLPHLADPPHRCPERCHDARNSQKS